MQHVLKIGVSAKELSKINLGWVVVQQYFEFFRQPDLGEELVLTTYPTGVNRIFTYRDFKVLDTAGKVVAQASSTWLLLDTETRKMAKYPPEISELLKPSSDIENLPRPSSLKFKVENPTYQRTFKVGFHDLDFNKHLSNFYYFRWMLDALPSAFLKNNQIEKLEMQFEEECYLDDEINVVIEQVDEKSFLHIMKKGERTLVKGKTTWK